MARAGDKFTRRPIFIGGKPVLFEATPPWRLQQLEQWRRPPPPPVRKRGRPSAKALIAAEIERRQKTPQRWPKNTFRSVVACDLWEWLEARRRSDKNIPRVKNPRAMASLLQRNQLWPPTS